MPSAEVAEDVLDGGGAGVINDGDDAHGVLANRATERVSVPNAQN